MKCDKETMLLYAVTDRAWVGRQSLYEQVESAIKGGVTCVQLREKQLNDEDFLKETLADLKDKLDSYIKSQASIEKKMQDLKETAYKCTNPDVAAKILEKGEDLQNDWDGYQAEIEDYQHYINKIEFISDLYSENKKNWNLYYYNC